MREAHVKTIAAVTDTGFVLKGWHVWSMLAGFFSAVIAVNALFIVLAVRSFPGEDVPRSYVQGLQYNSVLDARAREAALGWSASAALTTNADQAAEISVVMKDKAGAPILDADVSIELRRAATAREDRSITLTHRGDGVYAATLADLGRGGWRLRGRAVRGDATFSFTGSLAW